MNAPHVRCNSKQTTIATSLWNVPRQLPCMRHLPTDRVYENPGYLPLLLLKILK